MLRIILVNGLIAAAIIAGVSTVLLWTAGDDATHNQSAWLGYLVMVVGFSFIFVAIKQHRDKNLGGIIYFGQAFKVGFLVSLIAAFFYVFSWEIYYRNGGEDYIEKYQTSYLADLKTQGATEEVLSQTSQEMNEFAVSYKKIHFRALITLIEILPVGFVITLLSAFLLKTQRKTRT